MNAPEHVVVGAGPAGLLAAITLARAGRPVRVLERRASVGGRFAGDFQGLAGWVGPADPAERLAGLGVKLTFEHRAWHEVTFYDQRLRPVPMTSARPLFHLVRRGDVDESLDRALRDQARQLGARVELGAAPDAARNGTIVATGPRFADGLVVGYVFPTGLDDQAHAVISAELAPAGYAYLLVWDGRATLATCLFERHDTWRAARDATVRAFRSIVAGLDLSEAKPFSGFANVYGAARFSDEAGRLYVGEAAGLQDPEWGFGLWYAMESGALAARSLVEGFDYADAAARRFEPARRTGFVNRFVFELLPAAAYRPMLRAAARGPDLVTRIERHWQPSRLKSALAPLAVRAMRPRLHYRDRACHSTTCDCVWCTHGVGHEGETESAAGR